ncbi:MAG TPA: TlpA disulfide reductase family protein [Pyrinomonadaceae bacterium]
MTLTPRQSVSLICGVLVLLVSGFSALAQSTNGAEKSPKAAAATITVKDVDHAGLAALLKRQNGRPLLVNLWATWCEPCRDEFPDLVKIDAEYRPKGLDFITVSLDDITEIKGGVPSFLQEMGATMPAYLLNVVDPEPSIRAVDPNWGGALPATVLYDKDGRIVFKHFGRIKPAELRAAVQKALGSSQ